MAHLKAMHRGPRNSFVFKDIAIRPPITHIPVITKHLYKIYTMLDQRQIGLGFQINCKSLLGDRKIGEHTTIEGRTLKTLMS